MEKKRSSRICIIRVFRVQPHAISVLIPLISLIASAVHANLRHESSETPLLLHLSLGSCSVPFLGGIVRLVRISRYEALCTNERLF